MLDKFDANGAVHYHYGQFPPPKLDFERLVGAVGAAAAAIARYDTILRGLHNQELLLAPLRRQEAVISSRIEGTVATLDEVLKYEAEEEDDEDISSHRHETVEVFSYARALNHAQALMDAGLPLSGRLMKEAHSRLLFFGRGADKQPGNFKNEQNFVVDKGSKKILFVPISPKAFEDSFKQFEIFINRDDMEPLVQTALSHLEFEALHPFKDGNGRLGRMLITLMLWNRGLISAPHFYISGRLEERRDEYISRMRAVSASGEWTEWCLFFLEAIEAQARDNLSTANRISELYEGMKEQFRTVLSSQWSITALDFIFAKPVFRNSVFTSRAGIPRQTAHRFTNLLSEASLLTTVSPASGRRPALYAFEPLLQIVRT